MFSLSCESLELGSLWPQEVFRGPLPLERLTPWGRGPGVRAGGICVHSSIWEPRAKGFLAAATWYFNSYPICWNLTHGHTAAREPGT